MRAALHRACWDANLFLVSAFAEQGASINSVDKHGQTALHIAALTRNHLLAELLFQRGADTSVVSKLGQIPMDCANDDETLILLAKIMARDGKEQLARKRVELLQKSEEEKQRILKEIGGLRTESKRSSSFSKVKRKISVPKFFATKGTDSVQSSISNISECSNCDSGFSEPDISCYCPSTDSIQTTGFATSAVLSSEDSRAPDRRKTAPLSKKDLREVVQQAESTASLTRDRSKTTSISSNTTLTGLRSQSLRLQRRRRFLPKIPSSANFSDNLTVKRVSFQSEVILDDAICCDDFVEACHLIKSRKIDINIPSPNGVYPLHRAAIEGSYECLQLLIDQGAKVDIVDKYGWTPLHDAVFHGHVDCVLALVRAGANLYAETNRFHSVLELAEGDEMLLVVGRTLVLKELGQDCFSGKDGFVQPIPLPDRETCV